MQAAQVNTVEERNGCGFATMLAVHEITKAPKDFRALISYLEKLFLIIFIEEQLLLNRIQKT